jgi:predicted nucleic acid-binding protein
MLFDTDVLIGAFRGDPKAARAIDDAAVRRISLVTYLELLQGARDRREIRLVKGFLSDLGFGTLPLTENIGHRASVYLEEYGLKSGLRLADALIAATAVENGLVLLSGDRSHFRPIADLEVKAFRP